MNIPNALSLARLLLTPTFVVSVIYHTEGNPFLSRLPLIIFLVAVITDAVDGFIARRYSQITSLGILLDPLADKFLLAVSFITLSLVAYGPAHLKIPPWVLVIVLTRDLFILTGAAVIYFVYGYVEFKPSMLGKVTTFFQMATILSVLIQFKYSYAIWTLAALFTVFSGAHYLLRANRVLNGKTKHI
ncbi:MAG: CDP-alcohol phosphatidyltransferase family protein [Candidatus Omnitrophica bacterium]|nr:CDP-alcohol phosphatidyltransferase family protein [Candidatus Omnitrophota bacterium]MBU4488378.1 CDP-alcohol phosphatidyltransferase family protein [Candidatus Omnitrophota bacterium]MCG2705013.1 CDP-alcohol phosphatidyltransferase family protein [Candidatus Omnitrophota bacterium]